MFWGYLIGAIIIAFVSFGLGWMVARLSIVKSYSLLEADLNHINIKALELQEKLEVSEKKNTQLTQEVTELKVQLQQASQDRKEQLSFLSEMKDKLADQFKAISADALKSNQTSFLELAKQNLEKLHFAAESNLKGKQVAIKDLILPIKEQLQKVDGTLRDLEKERSQEYSGMKEQVRHLIDIGRSLQGETSNLTRALRVPHVRGRWGEMQLRRVVEISGMLNHCDFFEQKTAHGEDGKRFRPDMLIQMPSKKTIVVDSKAPLRSYLDALECEEGEKRTLLLKEHAKHVRMHLNQLSGKAYWEQFENSPEFVVLFLPGESFFSAALEQDPSLIEYGVENRVLLATPTTLIALLKTVAYGWRQEKLEENARLISELGRELHERICKVMQHFGGLRRGINQAVEAYNSLAGSIERRVLPSAKKLETLGASSKGILEPAPLLEKECREN